MADRKISQLTEVSSVTSDDNVVINSLGTTKRGTLGTVASWIVTNFTASLGGASQTIKDAIDGLQTGLGARAIGSSVTSFVIGQYLNFPLIRLVLSGGDQRQIATNDDGLKVEHKASGSSTWTTLWNIPRAIRPGDSVISIPITLTFSGYLTSSNTTIHTCIPIPRPLDSTVSGVTFTPTRISVRGALANGGYLMNGVTDFSGYTITATLNKPMNMVIVNIAKSSAFPNSLNNSPVAVTFNASLAFT